MFAIPFLGLLSLIASPAAAFWRLPCKSPLVVERADPIVSPGNVAGHVHQIMGGNGFDFTMTYASTQASTCSSCTVHADKSNYWTPVLYFQHQNGTFEKVDQVGGGLVYYLQRGGPNNDKLLAFPEGFRMLSGDAFKRSPGSDFASQAISYNCLDYNKSPPNPETGGFPNYNCPDGLRSQVFFPSCWDGQNLDSADHKSHMAFPIENYNGGSCPSSHPVHLISIFFEIIWDTNKFSGMWYGNQQPFVWAMGDPTGYGFHGDFVMGWNRTILQQAVDQCTNDSGQVEDCPVFQLDPDSSALGCKLASRVNEDVQGPFSQLPGCNPIQSGPGEARPVQNCAVNSTIGAGQSFFTDLTASGWSYQGCAGDSVSARSLTGASLSMDNMTNEYCVQYCGQKGFSMAGTEWSRECYCGNSIPSSAQPVPGQVGNCNMQCSGNANEYCGGSALLSLYNKCTGGSCSNAAGVDGSSAGGNTAGGVSSPGSAQTVLSTSTRTTTTTLSARSFAMTSSTSSLSTTKTSTSTSKTTTMTMTSSRTSSSSTFTPTVASDPAWKYLSCHLDILNPRTLPQLAPYVLNNNNMTTTNCLAYCLSNHFALAGTEYAGECWCGNSLPSGSTKQDESKCQMACKGDKTQYCGGSATLSLYGAKVNQTIWQSIVTRDVEMEDEYTGRHARQHIEKMRRGLGS